MIDGVFKTIIDDADNHIDSFKVMTGKTIMIHRNDKTYYCSYSATQPTQTHCQLKNAKMSISQLDIFVKIFHYKRYHQF